MNVVFSTVGPTHIEVETELKAAFDEVLNSDWFIRGSHCQKFEQEFATYCNTQYAIGVDNGLNAIKLILRALEIGPGDEVIIPSNTFIATALAVSDIGAKVVLVDPDARNFNISAESLENVLTPKAKAIIPVHLYGQCADMESILDFARQHKLYVVEDAAQAHGATCGGRVAGSMGIAGAFSFYPGKNLGALGDGGAIVTSDETIAQKVRALSNYGSTEKYHHEYLGTNSRLDELQAAFLSIKLKQLDRWTNERKRIAQKYLNEIKNPIIILPVVEPERQHVWHIFAIRCEKRDELQMYLKENDIETGIHYPIPINKQEAYAHYNFPAMPIAEMLSQTQLSLPMFYGMSEEETDYVIQKINSFEDTRGF